MYLLTHSLVLVLFAVMKPKVLKTKISHADPPTLSPVGFILECFTLECLPYRLCSRVSVVTLF